MVRPAPGAPVNQSAENRFRDEFQGRLHLLVAISFAAGALLAVAHIIIDRGRLRADPHTALLAGMLGLSLAVMLLLRWRRSVAVLRLFAVVLALATFVTVVVLDVTVRGIGAAAVVVTGTLLVTASLLPLGRVLHGILVAGGIGILFWGSGHAVDARPEVAAVVLSSGIAAFVLSWAAERQRLTRDRREDWLWRRQHEESLVAGCVSVVQHQLLLGLGQEGLMERAADASRLALNSDWSVIWMLSGSRYRCVVAAGFPPTDAPGPAGLELPEAMSREIGRYLERHEVGALETSLGVLKLPAAFQPHAQSGRGGGPVALVALRRDGALSGFLVVGREVAREPFGDIELRTMDGLGPVVSAALEYRHVLDQIRLASRAQDQFLATMSHELRTPLNVIAGYAEMLLDGGTAARSGLDPERRAILERMRTSTLAMGNLVDEAFEISRHNGSDRALVRAERVVLAEIVAEAMRAARARQPGSLAEVRAELSPTLPALISDPVKLHMVLVNLIDNGLKFTAAGEVLVGVGWQEGVLEIVVGDTGRGIDLGAQSAIFEAFVQDRPGAAGGLGLGLYLVQRHVASLGGEIRIESTPGTGSRFYLTLPALAAAARAGC